jgi:Domain of unknown function (DUF4249)
MAISCRCLEEQFRQLLLILISKTIMKLFRKKSLIFFIFPGHNGSKEPTTRRGEARRSQNQFTSPGDGINKLIFKRFKINDTMIKHSKQTLSLSILLLISSCVTQFFPQTNEDKELLVVEGLFTDQPDMNTIKLSRSQPLGLKTEAKPVTGCTVTVTDDLGSVFIFSETVAGTYVTNPSSFHGTIGRFYTLHISTNNSGKGLNYESFPIEMKAVPPIDSIYYVKTTLQEIDGVPSQEGCQIYLNTHDPTNKCKFYRWEYSETWEFHLPYTTPNNICWISNNSDVINIKSTSEFDEAKIEQYPLNFVSNQTDRLEIKYSILVNQYSMNEEEYLYWQKLLNFSQQVGGLYDMIPAAIPSNIYCTNDVNEKVLGYFSVSANSSKRIFVKGRFAGVISPYTNEACIADTAFAGETVPNLNISTWVIITNIMPFYQVYTYTRGCYDCTVRGTNIEPAYWREDK